MKFHFNQLTTERFTLTTEIMKGKAYFHAVTLKILTEAVSGGVL